MKQQAKRGIRHEKHRKTQKETGAGTTKPGKHRAQKTRTAEHDELITWLEYVRKTRPQRENRLQGHLEREI